MSSTPLTSCSMGVATVSASTLGFAPGYTARTTTVGGAISGYCAMGNWNTAINPTSTMTIERTAAKIGRRMKKWEKFMAIPPSVGHGSLRRTFPQFRLHHDSRTHAQQSFNDDLFTWLQPLLNHAQAVDHWADLYRAKLNLLLCVDYIDKFLRLI